METKAKVKNCNYFCLSCANELYYMLDNKDFSVTKRIYNRKLLFV